jgi:hypothetical protein
MKHLSSILLSIGVILSVVAIILPQWSVMDSATASTDVGLFEACLDVKVGDLDSGSVCKSLSSFPGPPPKDILVSQILSIVGTVALAIGAVMCMMMKPRYSKLAAGLGVSCLTAVLIVFATVTNSKDNGGGDLGASFWLELSAAVVGLIGLFVPAAKK